jgi:predicted RNA binding protein YcfA (HicA-like mRNA interferase family)
MPRFTPEHWRTLEAVFLAAGFRFVRQEGSHRSYVKAGNYAARGYSRLHGGSSIHYPQ